MLGIAKFIMQRSYLSLLIAGLLGGLSQMMIPLAIASSAVVALFTMRHAANSSLTYVLLSAVIMYALGLVLPTKPGIELPIGLLLLLPVSVCALALRETESHGAVVLLAGMQAIITALLIQVLSGDATAWWQAWLETAIKGVNGATMEGFQESGSLQIMNGLITSLLATVSILSVFLARWMLSMVIYPDGFRKEFHQLSLPKKLFWPSLLIVAGFFITGWDILLNLAIILSFMYAFQGLAVFHCSAFKNNYSHMAMLPPYLMLIFLPQFAVIGLACVGVSDVYLNYRKLP